MPNRKDWRSEQAHLTRIEVLEAACRRHAKQSPVVRRASRCQTRPRPGPPCATRGLIHQSRSRALRRSPHRATDRPRARHDNGPFRSWPGKGSHGIDVARILTGDAPHRTVIEYADIADVRWIDARIGEIDIFGMLPERDRRFSPIASHFHQIVEADQGAIRVSAIDGHDDVPHPVVQLRCVHRPMR